MYPPEDHSDQSSELLLAELIREQVLNRTREEIPHSVEVSVEEIAAREDGLVTVRAEVWAETESQKGILIGKGGAKVGEIGAAARRSLEAGAGRQGPPRPPGPRPPPLAPRRGPARPPGDRVKRRLLRSRVRGRLGVITMTWCLSRCNSTSAAWCRA